jgi:hypothetical protein
MEVTNLTRDILSSNTRSRNRNRECFDAHCRPMHEAKVFLASPDLQAWYSFLFRRIDSLSGTAGTSNRGNTHASRHLTERQRTHKSGSRVHASNPFKMTCKRDELLMQPFTDPIESSEFGSLHRQQFLYIAEQASQQLKVAGR